jgi:hypothetical protein
LADTVTQLLNVERVPGLAFFKAVERQGALSERLFCTCIAGLLMCRADRRVRNVLRPRS